MEKQVCESVLIENSRKMQKSVKTDISVAITPTPVIRFQEDRPCHAVQMPPFFAMIK
jgi:hypothetical protein